MELLMWVGVYALLIVINGTVSSELDNEQEAINLENVLATSDKKPSEDYQVLKELSGFCESNDDCQRSYAYVCNAKQCECADGYQPDATNTTCVGAVGMPCSYDNHCIVHAYCLQQTVCMCKMEYVASDDKWLCDASSHLAGNSSDTVFLLVGIMCAVKIFQGM